MKRFAFAVLSLAALCGLASACGPVVAGNSFNSFGRGFGTAGYGVGHGIGYSGVGYAGSNYYQASAYVAVPVAAALVTPYAPVISAQLLAAPVVPVAPAATVVAPQAQVSAGYAGAAGAAVVAAPAYAGAIQTYTAFYDVPLLTAFNFNYGHNYYGHDYRGHNGGTVNGGPAATPAQVNKVARALAAAKKK